MNWILAYILKMVDTTTESSIFKWMRSSCEEDNGKTSGKRLSAAFFSFLIAYMIHFAMIHPNMTPAMADFILWTIIALLGYIAAVFGMNYIPGRKNELKETEQIQKKDEVS